MDWIRSLLVLVSACGLQSDLPRALTLVRNAPPQNLIAQRQWETVVGGAGDDVLTTIGRRTTLVGGTGADTLTDRSASSTIFAFAPGSGRDTIRNFDAASPEHDLIQLRGFGLTRFSDVQSRMTAVDGDVVIRQSATDSVRLVGVRPSALNSSHFLLELDRSDLRLAFEDEFDRLSLWDRRSKSGRWKTNYFFGSQDGPREWSSRTYSPTDIYVDPGFAGVGDRPLGLNPFRVDRGVLSIIAEKTRPEHIRALIGRPYTTGVISTEATHQQTYGYFEIRAKLPTAKGLWPAFWLLPSGRANPPEIDVLEHVGGEQIFHSFHTRDAGAREPTFATRLPSNARAFHDYGVLWTPARLTWFIDGVATASTPTPSDMHRPMYLVASMAVGGDWPGDPDPDFVRGEMQIDRIRAYSLVPPAL